MNQNEHVATFTRLSDGNTSYGVDRSAKIYKITPPEGEWWYAVSLFEGDSLKSCTGEYVAYGYALKVVIEWIDNSEFYL